MTTLFDTCCIPKSSPLDRGLVAAESPETRAKRTSSWRKQNNVWAEERKALAALDDPDIVGDRHFDRLRDAHTVEEVLNMMDSYERGGW